MDYSLLKSHPSTPENLSVPNAYPVPASCYTDYLAATLPDPDRRTALTSPPVSAASCDADDALLMDCSRSTSSTAVTPNPPGDMATAVAAGVAFNHSHQHPQLTAVSAAADNTKLKLNFSMDRILSRDTEFRSAAAAARYRAVSAATAATPPICDDDSGCMGCDAMAGEALHRSAAVAAAAAAAEHETMFAPVAFSVASMLGLTTNGGKPVFRPMPVYMSQSVPLGHVIGSTSAATYLSPNASAVYSMAQQQRPPAVERRMPTQLQLLHQSPHTAGIHPVSSQHPHQQLHHHHHHLHHHQSPTLQIVESSCTTAAGGLLGPAGGGGGASSVAANNANNAKRKRSWSRAVFSQLQRKGLEIQFQIQKYITKPDRRKLAARLSLTDAQVKVWFQNRRMKWRHTRETKLGHPQHTHGDAKLAAGQSAADDHRKHDETSSSSDEDEIDVVAE